MLMNKKMISLLFLFILLTVVLSGCTSNTSEQVVDYKTDFEFTLLNGTKKNMSEYHGKVVLLDFFGVYCQPCQYQMLVLEKIFEEYKDKNLEIISIDVWIASGETSDLVISFLQSAKDQGVYLDWIFGLDDAVGTLLNKYANNGVPMIYILDKNGNIYYSKNTYTEYSVIKSKLDEILD
jgi:thiol-disulfide isomerase/thioredoxin